MRALAVDASTHAGWAYFEGEPGRMPKRIESGLVENKEPILSFGRYPWGYLHAAASIANQLSEIVDRLHPDIIVVEETNLGKSRYSQKILEFIHFRFLQCMYFYQKLQDNDVDVVYISSSSWRKAIQLTLTKEDKENNAKLKKAKQAARRKKSDASKAKKLAEAKKKLGVKGKIDKKHLSVRYVNDHFGLNLKLKDNDEADAICLGVAYFLGAKMADGT